MKIYVLFSILSLSVLVMYSNCGKVGESGLATSESVIEEGDPARGILVYSTDGDQPACINCHGSDGMLVIGVDLKTFSDSEIRGMIRGTGSVSSGAMPVYDTIDLSEQDLADVIAYIRTL
jgi:mono/diheme cytochrome c family protein